jgi:LPXTG-site transpeptidase (sortase) family protein
MKLKISRKWSLVIFSVVGIAIATVIVSFLVLDHGSRASATSSTGGQIPQNSGPAGSAGLPTRLVIPEINVDAAIEDVGLTAQGAMAVPAGPADVAWFDLGPRPGETGSAVIAGHEGWKDGISAVFDDLYKLRVGDKVYIDDQGGATTTFVVSGIQTYDQNGNAVAVFDSNDRQAHLNLITCEGTWNAAQKSYSNRLVVFTNME